MAKGNSKKRPQVTADSGINLKGTFISVMLLGVFILVLWFGLYALFLSR
ncbi:cytochrome c oxidase subunit 2A [Sporosarcina sp. ACRSL]|nr:cytochrome c oxidase subunit 2A [Sporosarcina sp. ACRSL]MCG7344302.1 cytochrome c oxidase subunit 2A [Sporosarcina sp. ACRSL]